MGLPGIAPDAKSDPFAPDEIAAESKYSVSKTGNGPKPFKVTDNDTGEVIGMYKTRFEAEAKVRELGDVTEAETSPDGDTSSDPMGGMDSGMGGGMGDMGGSKDKMPMFSHGTQGAASVPASVVHDGFKDFHTAFKKFHTTLHARGND